MIGITGISGTKPISALAELWRVLAAMRSHIAKEFAKHTS